MKSFQSRSLLHRDFFQFIVLILWPTTVLLIFGGSQTQPVVVSAKIQHANSYAIRSVAEDNCLTATRHTFRADDGIFIGEVLTSQCISLTYQYWDAIRWRNTPENQFWLFPKSASFNELTIVPDIEVEMETSSGQRQQQQQQQNVVEILYLPIKAKDTKSGSFLIRSIALDKCIQSNGAEFRISYEPCDFSIREQQWTAEPLVYVDTNSFKC